MLVRRRKFSMRCQRSGACGLTRHCSPRMRRAQSISLGHLLDFEEEELGAPHGGYGTNLAR